MRNVIILVNEIKIKSMVYLIFVCSFISSVLAVAMFADDSEFYLTLNRSLPV